MRTRENKVTEEGSRGSLRAIPEQDVNMSVHKHTDIFLALCYTTYKRRVLNICIVFE